jgi:hypothetical protein
VNGWSNAAVTNINGAATSILRVTTAAKFGTACAEIVCPATIDTGASFPIYRRFKRGVTYTAEAWFRSAAGTTLAYLRLGNGPGNDKASSTAVALSTTWTKHTVTWTPTADREVVHVAANIGAATGTTWTVDGISVYEGTTAPTLSTQIEGRGAAPPVGILEAEACDRGDLSVFAITARAADRCGYGLQASVATLTGTVSYNERRRAEYAAQREAEHRSRSQNAEQETARAGSPEPRTRRAAATPDEGGLDTVFGLY